MARIIWKETEATFNFDGPYDTALDEFRIYASIPTADAAPAAANWPADFAAPSVHDQFVLSFADAIGAPAGKGKNRPPNAKNDNNNADPVIEAGSDGAGDSTAAGNVLANDKDPNGDKLKAKPLSIEGTYGTLELDKKGAWTYTLDNTDADTEALASGQTGVEKFTYTAVDGHGGKDTAILKIKIAGSDELPPPVATIALDAVTADNTLNSEEADGKVTITGTTGGDVADGALVTLEINGKETTGTVTGTTFAIEVDGTDLQLDGDATIKTSVTATNAAGVSVTGSTTRVYGVDTTPPEVTIALNPVTADNVLNALEAGGDVTITGTVGGDVKDGDTVSLLVNGVTKSGTISERTFAIDVKGTDLKLDPDRKISAAITVADDVGNTRDATVTQSYDIDTTLPNALIQLDKIAGDDLLSIDESNSDAVIITGSVFGDVKAGDIVAVVINNVTYQGEVADGNFAIQVTGSDLLADSDLTLDARVTTFDASGNSVTATDSGAYTVDTVPPVATIAVDAITGDDVINIVENASTSLFIGGTLTGEFSQTDIVTVSVNNFSFPAEILNDRWEVELDGASLVADTDLTLEVTLNATDGAGNSSTVFAVRQYATDLVAPTGSVTILPVTDDGNVTIGDVVDRKIPISGFVAGDEAKEGDVVTVYVDGDEVGTTALDANKQFVFAADSAKVAQSAEVSATVQLEDVAGNTAEFSATATYTVELVQSAVQITLDMVTGDDLIEPDEWEDPEVELTGSLSGDFTEGDYVWVSLNDTTYVTQVTNGVFAVTVDGSGFRYDDDWRIELSTRNVLGVDSQTFEKMYFLV